MSHERLADRMRPRTLDDIVGQEHLFTEDSLLRRMIEKDTIYSIILYGPPGTGKTSIANVIANVTKSDFEIVNAVTSGKKDIETVCKKAEKNLENNTRTIMFIDEIHRFNKAQQDYLLPFVEKGTVILIGATTENPFFEVNPALISRSTLFELHALTTDDIKKAVQRAITDTERGLGNLKLTIQDDALNLLAEQANGDVRHALTTLELVSVYLDGRTDITTDDIKAVLTNVNLRYDKDGDMHYDTISAFIKSMRGSDPDAVLYYLARMIKSGEDPKFIARRIMIAASEDVGNADPMALVVATNASLAVERIGWPEGRIILSQAALYVAMAPKSNTSYVGIDNALDYIEKHPSNEVPPHLQDAHYKSAAKLGHGVGYQYPHDYPDHWCQQAYLPDSVQERFYQNSHIGYEKQQAAYLNAVIQNAAMAQMQKNAEENPS